MSRAGDLLRKVKMYEAETDKEMQASTPHEFGAPLHGTGGGGYHQFGAGTGGSVMDRPGRRPGEGETSHDVNPLRGTAGGLMNHEDTDDDEDDDDDDVETEYDDEEEDFEDDEAETRDRTPDDEEECGEDGDEEEDEPDEEEEEPVRSQEGDDDEEEEPDEDEDDDDDDDGAETSEASRLLHRRLSR